MTPKVTITGTELQNIEAQERAATLARLLEFQHQDALSGFTNQEALGLAWIDREPVEATIARYLLGLIPAPVKASPDGTALPYWDWTYPRSEAYEAASTPLLPAGWKLYSVVDGEKHPTMSGRDFGATRGDIAHVFGVRDVDGTPRHLRAHVASGSVVRDGAEKIFPPHALAEACRWCDERIAEQGR